MRMLDLFCGEGLAAWGYWLSGRFTEIVGVDTDSDRLANYSFDKHKMSAWNLTYEFLDQFDFIHASPPCQAYSYGKRYEGDAGHLRLVAATHLMLYASGKPYVIENVQGAIKELRPNLSLDGHYFGLPMERRRYFHLSTLSSSIQLMKAGESTVVHGSEYVSRDDLIKTFGLDVINERRLRNLTVKGIKQGIAPAMTKFIAELMFPHKAKVG